MPRPSGVPLRSVWSPERPPFLQTTSFSHWIFTPPVRSPPLVSEPARPTTRPPALDERFPVPLRGVRVDAATRCVHYDGPRDVVAIRFACCDLYYPCFRCHRAVADHDPARWPKARRREAAVLCGACRRTMSAARYLAGAPTCPHCGAAFNPGCAAHHDRYFA
jgi:uncharacterized CHY-type Zn-finger protein